MNSYQQAVTAVMDGLKNFFAKTFTSYSIEGPKLDPAKVQSSPLMLVSTHRSHLDYFFVGFIFNILGFKNFRFAAGDNLTTLPWIGKKFLNFGAFPIARDTGFDRNYVRNLCFNVVSMIEKGDIVLVFPEGGRSYSGSMLEMRTGVLGALVISQAKDSSRDVNFIPVAASYEFPPEVPWFSMQLRGKSMRKRGNSFVKRLFGNILYFGADIRTFLPILLARYFGYKYGALFIDYGEPVSVRSVVDVVAGKAADARDEFSAHRASMQKLGEDVNRRLFALYRVLPMHVVAAELREHGSRSITELADAFPAAIEGLRANKRNVKQLEKLTATENADTGIKKLRAMGAVTFRGNRCAVRNKALIEYFAATIG